MLPKGSKIMTRWGRIFFYADMQNVGFPQDSARKTFEHAIEKKADFIVVDGVLIGMRPQLAILFKPFYSGEGSILKVFDEGDGYRPFPWLKLHLLYKDPSSVGLAVYKILYEEIKD